MPGERVERPLRTRRPAADAEREPDREGADDPEADTLCGEPGTAQIADPVAPGGPAGLPLGVANGVHALTKRSGAAEWFCGCGVGTLVYRPPRSRGETR